MLSGGIGVVISVDVARVESVANGAAAAAAMAVVASAGAVFPADGVCVDVREGSAAVSGLAGCGPGAGCGVVVGGCRPVVPVPVVPRSLSAVAPVRQGEVSPDQVVVTSVQRPVPVWSIGW